MAVRSHSKEAVDLEREYNRGEASLSNNYLFNVSSHPPLFIELYTGGGLNYYTLSGYILHHLLSNKMITVSTRMELDLSIQSVCLHLVYAQLLT